MGQKCLYFTIYLFTSICQN